MKEKTYTVDGIEFIAFDVDSSETLKFLQDEFDMDMMDIKTMNLPDDPVIVDIGANVGIISFYFAKRFPNAKIYSYEPHPINYANLIRGIEANGLTNVFPFNKAVLDNSDSGIEIYLNRENSGASSVFHSTEDSAFVDTITLEEIVAEHQIEKIDFLKIDCEGSEFEILENSEILYTGNLPIQRMFVEIHAFRESEGKKSISLLIAKMNYIKGVSEFRFIII
jgi:FkbM family methyltransferase